MDASAHGQSTQGRRRLRSPLHNGLVRDAAGARRRHGDGACGSSLRLRPRTRWHASCVYVSHQGQRRSPHRHQGKHPDFSRLNNLAFPHLAHHEHLHWDQRQMTPARAERQCARIVQRSSWAHASSTDRNDYNLQNSHSRYHVSETIRGPATSTGSRVPRGLLELTGGRGGVCGRVRGSVTRGGQLCDAERRCGIRLA